MFAAKPVAFGCSCSRERVEHALRIAGAAEIESILAERGDVEVTCEFCNRRYAFAPARGASAVRAGGRRHPALTRRSMTAMSLYPAHFVAPDDRAATARVLHDYPFATLITPGAPEPFVSHVPLLHVADARAARHADRPRRARQSALAAVQRTSSRSRSSTGPHAYVSPSWYAAAGPHGPDVELRGRPRPRHARTHRPTRSDARAVLDALIARFESSRGEPWAMQRLADTAARRDDRGDRRVPDSHHAHRRQVQAVAESRRSRSCAARRGLAAEGYAEATATADWMKRYAGAGDNPDGSR